MVEVGERHHRRPGRHDLAELRLPDQYDAGDGSGEDGVAQLHPGHLERFTGECKFARRTAISSLRVPSTI